MNCELRRRNLREPRMGSAALTDDTIESVLGAAVSRMPAKLIARAGRACERTADNWRAGMVPRSWVRLVHLMRADRQLCDAVLAMVDREPATITDAERRAAIQALRILAGER